jgi:hypothetical protein
MAISPHGLKAKLAQSSPRDFGFLKAGTRRKIAIPRSKLDATGHRPPC